MKCAVDVTARHKSSTGNEEENRGAENKHVAAFYVCVVCSMHGVDVLDVARHHVIAINSDSVFSLLSHKI